MAAANILRESLPQLRQAGEVSVGRGLRAVARMVEEHPGTWRRESLWLDREGKVTYTGYIRSSLSHLVRPAGTPATAGSTAPQCFSGRTAPGGTPTGLSDDAGAAPSESTPAPGPVAESRLPHRRSP